MPSAPRRQPARSSNRRDPRGGSGSRSSSAGSRARLSGRWRCRWTGGPSSRRAAARSRPDRCRTRAPDERACPSGRGGLRDRPDRELLPVIDVRRDDPDPGIAGARGRCSGSPAPKNPTSTSPEQRELLDRGSRHRLEAQDDSVQIAGVWSPVVRLRTSVSCFPRSQRSTRKGPFPIGLPVSGCRSDRVQRSRLEVLARGARAGAGREVEEATAPARVARARKTTRRLGV